MHQFFNWSETFKIRKMKNIQFVLIVVMVLYACSRQNIYKDIVGTWNTNNGEKIVFYKNGVCSIKNVDFYQINPFPQNKGIKINTNKANWSIINNELIHITYELPNRNGQGGLDLYYSDSILFFWQGDPDDNKKIEFKAQG
ncbi:hypothetical protein HMPREF9296_0541 [Prevotella disiens FB035-09AN]|uniref:Lipocalin-like domain-containing protein n=2 Tax=Prevotella disiens TaxID=28130 RepID=E1KMF2_9BACT|nr:hypothetical protein HMPREF9296_0541 [Prevotella disiens FB035-09AN]